MTGRRLFSLCYKLGANSAFPEELGVEPNNDHSIKMYLIKMYLREAGRIKTTGRRMIWPV
jgi:hypothetical protein